MEHQYQQQALTFAQQEEQAYFAEYDRAFDQVTYQADYDDYMYEQEEYTHDDNDDDDMMMMTEEQEQEEYYNNYYYNAKNNNMNDNDFMNEQQEEEDDHVEVDEESEKQQEEHGYDYQRDSLLHLIVGVQSYLSDANALHQDRNDSPLVDLQYKMYTYLKQRACDMGVDMEMTATQQQ
ncbi:hypothetical protein BDA99DRAFT_506695 [Phascolomyces articulosus]|uniref:Uncharacterized protein n=1 Tax=Phascolomyces articulosus TaxID=60185 RepID=A0AAD5PH51_9FUNG|nr:hypothetical protein BDA99DRAFT_506695 [Phascolomyces articulosus]